MPGRSGGVQVILGLGNSWPAPRMLLPAESVHVQPGVYPLTTYVTVPTPAAWMLKWPFTYTVVGGEAEAGSALATRRTEAAHSSPTLQARWFWFMSFGLWPCGHAAMRRLVLVNPMRFLAWRSEERRVG